MDMNRCVLPTGGYVLCDGASSGIDGAGEPAEGMRSGSKQLRNKATRWTKPTRRLGLALLVALAAGACSSQGSSYHWSRGATSQQQFVLDHQYCLWDADTMPIEKRDVPLTGFMHDDMYIKKGQFGGPFGGFSPPGHSRPTVWWGSTRPSWAINDRIYSECMGGKGYALNGASQQKLMGRRCDYAKYTDGCMSPFWWAPWNWSMIPK